MTSSCMHRVAVLLLFALALLLVTPPIASAKVGQSCGGFVGPICGAGEFCQKPTGRCFWFDIPGTCVRIPKICSMIYRPVCGCDNKTYANDCVRQRAGVSKLHDGRC